MSWLVRYLHQALPVYNICEIIDCDEKIMRLPPLKTLPAFIAVAEQKSFVNASAILNISVGAVSQQIKQLEADLQSRLFDRNPRGVSLTLLGERYYKQISQALNIIDQATVDLQPVQQVDTIRIQVGATLAVNWLIPVLSHLYQTLPNIQLNLLTTRESVQQQNTNVDFSIVYADSKPCEDAIKLWKDDLILLMPYDHDTDDLPIICVDHSLRKADWEGYFGSNVQRKTLSVSSTLQALEAVKNGLGIFVTHSPLIASQKKSFQVHPKVVENDYAYYLVDEAPLRQNVMKRLFKQWLLAQARDYAQG